MTIKQFLLLFFESLNPRAYRSLISRKKRDVAKYFFVLILYCVILSGLTNIPNFVKIPSQVEGTLSKISKLNITGLDVEITEPVTLLDQPKIVIDFSPNLTIDNEWILITKENVQFKKLQLKLFEPISTQEKPIEEYSNVLQSANMINGTYCIILFIMLPSLFFLSYLLNFAKYSIIVTFVLFLSFIATKILKRKIRFQNLLKSVFFASTIMIFLDIVISPLINLSIVPFLLYLGILSLVLKDEKHYPQKK